MKYISIQWNVIWPLDESSTDIATAWVTLENM